MDGFMKLYLARHGDYVLSQGLDVLSEKGSNDMMCLAALLKPMNLHVASILHSGKNRAQQTAELLTQGFYCKTSPESHLGLKPDDDVLMVAEELTHWNEDVLIVGHLPFMGRFVSQLLIGNDKKEIINFQTGTLVCLSQLDKAHWVIDWVLNPECCN